VVFVFLVLVLFVFVVEAILGIYVSAYCCFELFGEFLYLRSRVTLLCDVVLVADSLLGSYI
jgi:hypothetical protein